LIEYGYLEHHGKIYKDLTICLLINYKSNETPIRSARFSTSREHFTPGRSASTLIIGHQIIKDDSKNILEMIKNHLANDH
jgi:hypothetical protein